MRYGIETGVGNSTGEDRHDRGFASPQGLARLPHLFERENCRHIHLDAAARKVADNVNQRYALRMW